jgi:hypothetical protein
LLSREKWPAGDVKPVGLTQTKKNERKSKMEYKHYSHYIVGYGPKVNNPTENPEDWSVTVEESEPLCWAEAMAACARKKLKDPSREWVVYKHCWSIGASPAGEVGAVIPIWLYDELVKKNCVPAISRALASFRLFCEDCDEQERYELEQQQKGNYIV